MLDAGLSYRIRRTLAKTAPGAISVMLACGILGGSVGITVFLWLKTSELNSELLSLSEELRHTQARVRELNALRGAAFVSQAYAYVAANAAVAVHSDVGQLAEMTRQGWEAAAKRYRHVDVPDFEPELMCYEH